jgi:hypothetical protein
LQEALLLSDEYIPTVRLHATAVFSILNSHIRREDRGSRVIGTLLGNTNEGYINVTCLVVILDEINPSFIFADH